MGEDDFSIDLKDIASNLKNSSIANGLSLSDLPPLFVEEDDIIKITFLKLDLFSFDNFFYVNLLILMPLRGERTLK